MKKSIFTFSLMLVTLAIFAQAQPISWAGASGNNPAHQPPPTFPADDLQVLPGGSLLWTQGPGCIGPISSEIISSAGLVSNCADDFIFTTGYNVTAARWWFGYYNSSYSTLSSWNITIYDNAACLPGNIVQQWTIPFNLSNEILHCYDIYGFGTYSYWADLSPVFVAAPNTTYWISVQAGDHDFPPGQWGWDYISAVTGCQGAFKSVTFGYPEYLPAGALIGYPIDFSFELYGGETNQTPVSNWALFIGIGLILVAAVIRFRRLI